MVTVEKEKEAAQFLSVPPIEIEADFDAAFKIATDRFRRDMMQNQNPLLVQAVERASARGGQAMQTAPPMMYELKRRNMPMMEGRPSQTYYSPQPYTPAMITIDSIAPLQSESDIRFDTEGINRSMTHILSTMRIHEEEYRRMAQDALGVPSEFFNSTNPCAEIPLVDPDIKTLPTKHRRIIV